MFDCQVVILLHIQVFTHIFCCQVPQDGVTRYSLTDEY
jgi:hypothetical protein